MFDQNTYLIRVFIGMNSCNESEFVPNVRFRHNLVFNQYWGSLTLSKNMFFDKKSLRASKRHLEATLRWLDSRENSLTAAPPARAAGNYV